MEIAGWATCIRSEPAFRQLRHETDLSMHLTQDANQRKVFDCTVPRPWKIRDGTRLIFPCFAFSWPLHRTGTDQDDRSCRFASDYAASRPIPQAGRLDRLRSVELRSGSRADHAIQTRIRDYGIAFAAGNWIRVLCLSEEGQLPHSRHDLHRGKPGGSAKHGHVGRC